MKYTNDQIYKMYKHGESFSHTGLTIKRIFNALKQSLTVVIVDGDDGCKIIYNYVPEEKKFYHVFQGY